MNTSSLLRTDYTSSRVTPLTRAHNRSGPDILFPVSERSLAWLTKDGNDVPFKSHKAIVRRLPNSNDPNQNVVLAVARTTYKVVHNNELFAACEQAMLDTIPNLDPEYVVIRDAFSRHGKQCIRQYIFKQVRCNIGAKSDIALRIVVSNSYGGSAIKILGGAIEFYCSNGIVRGAYDRKYIRHTRGLVLDDVVPVIEGILNKFAKDAEQWKDWTKQRVASEKAMEFFKAIAKNPQLYEDFGAQYLEEIEERGPTLWAVYSTLTNWASHGEVGSRFATRTPNAPAQAALMLQREFDVMRWTSGEQFAELARV